MDTGKGMMLPGAPKMWERGGGSEGSGEESKGGAGKRAKAGQAKAHGGVRAHGRGRKG